MDSDSLTAGFEISATSSPVDSQLNMPIKMLLYPLGEGTRSVAMNRTAQCDECLLKAQELFFPKQTSQFRKLTGMADCHLANYNGERITNKL